MNRTICLAVIAIFAFTQVASANCVDFDKQRVALPGKVVRTHFYGPPNFGENPKSDRHDVVAVLVLDRPIWTCGIPANLTGHGGKYRVRKLEMVFSKGPYEKQWYGKRVVATGTLYPWDNALQYTPVLLSIEHVAAEAKHS